MNEQVVYIKHRSGHHARHSGYSQLIDYMQGSFLPKNPSFIPYRIRKALASFTDQDAGIYNSESIDKEASLTWLMMKKKRGLAHFLNGERDIRFTTLFKNYKHWKFVATFHKPPDILKKNITNFRYLSRLDGAIAVGPNQIEILKEKLKINTVSFIPHGIDTTFFTPSSQSWESNTCIFVGQHLRDFSTLGNCLSIIQKRIPNFKLRVVIRKDATHLLPHSDAIEVFSGISDDQLRELYRTSTALLLPLTDATACNSILEALACGLPVITNATGGVEAYLEESCGFILPVKDFRGMAEATIHLMEDEDTNAGLRANCRESSLRFSWENVADKTLGFYKSLNP